jgi:hypothetical protein
MNANTATAPYRAEILGGLTQYHAKALAALGSTWTDESAHKAIAGSLAADGKRIAELAPDGRLGRDVLAGVLTHEKWVAIAKITWEDISAQVSILKAGAWSWSNVWDQVIVPSAKTLREGAGDLGKGGESALMFAAIGLVALVLLRVLGLVRS